MQSVDPVGQQGFSILEVLIIVTLAGVLMTFALIQIGGAKTDVQRQNIVREFKNYLERARFDSVRRRAVADAEMATITLTTSTSFVAKVDFNGDGQLSTTETRSVDFNDRTNTQIYVSETLNYPVKIRFNHRGQTTATDSLGNPVASVFRICSNCSSATPDVSYISISLSGTIADSKAAPGVLPTPAVSNVASPSYNCYVLIGNTNSGCSLF